MKIWRKKRGVLLTDERGFTLPELLTTIAILGILLAIAMAMWNSVIEARRVDAAANQLASDLRLANTRATNQLTDWRVIYAEGEPSYHLVKLRETCPEATCALPVAEKTVKRTLPEGTAIVGSSNGPDPTADDRFALKDAADNALPVSINNPGVTSTIEFNSDGSSYAASGPIAGLKVGSIDNTSRCWKLTVQSATSRVKQAKTDGCS